MFGPVSIRCSGPGQRPRESRIGGEHRCRGGGTGGPLLVGTVERSRPLDRTRHFALRLLQATPDLPLAPATLPATHYLRPMSPTILRVRGYRFYFFSREEARPHVHVQHATGEAKFWLDPTVEVAQNWGLSKQRLTAALRFGREHADEIRRAWETHFGG